ncbi:sel1 repeat family protein [Rhodoblastus acidophilus]|uniref:Sel1 repeat family protein n=1 Tax=Candidatus Rhodoblastus alkanivorans TaxID=2954117 RepID=A0ABS9Z853_9HYPH|nr:tetratricopeptide repeat protein [Candidatus Rhodoblastus alkanivorans]MCI4677933.1 sel1 repeat family protein [Candidatus Rhodoblastus alkanivorans]MCI4683828.1 sel1 repeat family protein [Candidatus Rhodoblastus alkanivorans]MDI4641146.1 sel1 repeat family protein [Rhodoblastus acidophilus]
MVAFGRIFLACMFAMCNGAAAFAFDGAASSSSSRKTLDIFKNPHQALEAALESFRAGNAASSVEALKYAAAGGEPLAQWKLGKMYAAGDGVPHDDFKAYQYFLQIVDKYADDDTNWREKSVVASAFVAVGAFELKGIPGSHLKPDPDRAMRMFRYAATMFGDPNAQYNLARLYMDGAAGLIKDNRQAARWLYLAAEKGHVESQALLGHLLFSGDGLPVQRARGLMWLTLAREGANGKGQGWVKTLYDEDMKVANDNDRQVALVYLEEHLKRRD